MMGNYDELVRKQNVSLMEAEERCRQTLEDGYAESMAQERDGTFCPGIWDNVMCWEDTKAGTIARQKCPGYILQFNTEEYATKECLPNGSWYYSPFFNKTYTDFTRCQIGTPLPADLLVHMSRIQLMYQIGYGISLTSLVIAVTIMLTCRGLHSKINRLHLNLFLSLTLKAIVTFLKESFFVQGLGLSMDIGYKDDGRLYFIADGTHWQCKLLITVWIYSIATVYTWILVEGLYLTNLVKRTLSTDRSGVKYYIIFGWAFPFTYIIPWIFVRIFLDDQYCWVTYKSRLYYWLYQGAIFASVIITFILFLLIIRVLCTRLAMSERHVNRKYRKLAKFTLVLMLLFGVHFTLFLFIPDSADLIVPRLYADMFSNAFQGLFVSLFFCFLNEEVLLAIKRAWGRFAARQKSKRQLLESFRLQSQRSDVRNISTGKKDHGVQVYTRNEDRPSAHVTVLWRRPVERIPSNKNAAEEDGIASRKFRFVDKRNTDRSRDPELVFVKLGNSPEFIERRSRSPDSDDRSSRRSSCDHAIDSGVHSSEQDHGHSHGQSANDDTHSSRV